jgi:uncharacterized protein YbjT (DUF2867 family)
VVVARLLDAECHVRVLTRHPQKSQPRLEFVAGDLSTGVGIEAAVEGITTIVHCAGTNKGDEVKAQYVARAAARAGAGHLVFISVVGADRIPVTSAIDRAMFGYFASKLAAERVVADSGVPWTTLRATQFHDLVWITVRQMSRLPVIPVPVGFRFQPVDAGEVAARLVELAVGKPAGLVPDMAGPRVYEMATLIREYLRASRKHRLLVPVWLPGKAARAVRMGGNVAFDQPVGRRTWEEFLASRMASSRPLGVSDAQSATPGA